ncbi:MAG: Alpha/Beta hydrolase protein [Olpidium bornovanus]|uniref:Alpha/Beta hydrolase protein n=1 Tax=Olpidium bornovanus TaxID=278681 RepID=A0A8H8DGX3_9FUNG|nr:MAG: Alpha/Beta hydrolase protein [Olpidium bornovanus]
MGTSAQPSVSAWSPADAAGNRETARVGVREVLDVPYGDDGGSCGAANKQAVDFYFPEDPAGAGGSPPPVVVYVHGGAWRTGDRKAYRELANRLASEGSFLVAVVGYRLSSSEQPFLHPGPVVDTARALALVRDKAAEEGYDAGQIYLCGHSAGAQITGLLVLVDKYLGELCPPGSRTLRDCVQGVVAVEGIFDIKRMLDAHPSYIDFVQTAFGPQDNSERALAVLRDASPQYHDVPTDCPNFPHYLVIHSAEDELLEIPPSQAFQEHLNSGGAAACLELGLKGDHFGILHTDEFRRRLVQFVRETRGRPKPRVRERLLQAKRAELRGRSLDIMAEVAVQKPPATFRLHER